MFDYGYEQQANYPSQGLLRPGRFFWARAVPWGIVFGIVLWIAYKFVKGVWESLWGWMRAAGCRRCWAC